jgi:hypothetical protein
VTNSAAPAAPSYGKNLRSLFYGVCLLVDENTQHTQSIKQRQQLQIHNHQRIALGTAVIQRPSTITPKPWAKIYTAGRVLKVTSMSDRSEIEWAPRVSLTKIRALYINEARGTCDDELIEEVGFGLLARCRSILEYTAACETGEVRCMRCAKQGQTSIIQRNLNKPSMLIRCPVCGWQVRWRVYKAESENADGQLIAGHAGDAFTRYAAVYPQCRTREEKILAIDRLIHEFHWILVKKDQPARANKTAAVNLLRGNILQVLTLLNELTYGENTPPELIEEKVRWLKQQKRGPANT